MTYFVEYAAVGKFGCGKVRVEPKKTVKAAIKRAEALSKIHGTAYVLHESRSGHWCYVTGDYDHQDGDATMLIRGLYK